MVKDLSDKKPLTAYTSAAGTVSLALRFLQAEKEKQIRAIGLTQLLAHLLLAQLPPYYDLYKRKSENRYMVQLPLPSHCDFYKQKSENRYVQPAWHSGWYIYLRITTFTSGKTGKRYSCCPRITIFTSRKTKTDMCNRPDIAVGTPTSVLRFLQVEKWKQGAATGLTPAATKPVAASPTLYFHHRKSENMSLRPAWHICNCCSHVTIFMSGKQKQVRATGLTYLQLLPLRYDFYKRKSENK